ncbi:Release factor [Glarea lozoyensis ATCC 20868]|uniref:Release factor n=1 Tax=Glarea lozoyensis (strain ATCC 20868 / MF5171) TaxID=1116229 RepID=S3CUA6_GLAL2|nr:Release factor [Glarea lozoyensis ATCC 20868]EPE28599.1 Release factor [Glarea lozoyensis ATCC 20868]
MAKEHDRLTEETAETFDAKISKRIGELKNVTTALRAWEESESAMEELHALLQDPTTDDELRELATEDMNATQLQLETLSQSLSKSLIPKHPFEDMPCLMEIRPGAGGGEAAIFAGDLLRMYRAFCARRGYRVSLMKYDTADGESGDNGEAPLAEAILEIEASGAYGELRSEAGVHRVQRVPATEKSGRTHTSAASVLVLPSLPATGSSETDVSQADMNDPESDYYVNAADVKTDVYRSRGAGGQHVNTTDSAVRLTHIPTNTVVAMQDSRSQHKNREKAWQLLRSKIAQAKREAREAEVSSIRRGVIGVAKMGRENKIRTYNWGQQRVSDHRSGINVHNLDDVMEGGPELDKVIDSVKAWMGEQEMQALLAEEQEASKAPLPNKKK